MMFNVIISTIFQANKKPKYNRIKIEGRYTKTPGIGVIRYYNGAHVVALIEISTGLQLYKSKNYKDIFNFPGIIKPEILKYWYNYIWRKRLNVQNPNGIHLKK